MLLLFLDGQFPLLCFLYDRLGLLPLNQFWLTSGCFGCLDYARLQSNDGLLVSSLLTILLLNISSHCLCCAYVSLYLLALLGHALSDLSAHPLAEALSPYLLLAALLGFMRHVFVCSE